MRASEEAALASKLGFDPEDLDFLRRNRQEFEQWKAELKRRSQSDSRTEEANEDNGQYEEIDFSTELETKFEQDGNSDLDEPPLPPRPALSPGTRRKRIQEQIED